MPKKLVLSEEKLTSIINDYNSGMSLRQLQIKYSHDRASLSRILKENEIMIKDNTFNCRKYFHDEDFFEKIDAEEKAYWLGFIYADGFIDNTYRHLGITISSKDKNHLEKFKSSIQATNPILNYVGSGYCDDSEFAKISLVSKKTVDDLIDKGISLNKTYEATFPDYDIVPPELMHHFVRGYFDGDGAISYCISKQGRHPRAYGIGFTGTKSIIEGINSFFHKKNKIQPKNNAYQIGYGGNQQVHEFYNIMYDNATTFLDRKAQVFDDFIKYIER